MGTVQQRNAEQVELLRADFQGRWEPNFAWKSAVSAGLVLPALRAFWPMSSVGYAAASRCRDASGGGNHLGDNNTVSFRYHGASLIPIADFGGTNQYLDKADVGAANWADITGLEVYIPASLRGLTLGGWFYFDDAAPPAAQEILMGKRSNAAGNYSYWLRREAVAGRGEFKVSDDGTNLDTVTTATVLLDSEWHFIVGRFNPGASVDIFTNGTWATAATARASAFDGTAAFCIGSLSGGGGYLDGKASLCFLCACELPDAIVECFYAQTKPMFGVN